MITSCIIISSGSVIVNRFNITQSTNQSDRLAVIVYIIIFSKNNSCNTHALQCAADLSDRALVSTHPYNLCFLRASLMVRFTETFRLSLVQLLDLIGVPGLWVLAYSEGTGFIVAMFYGQFFNLKKIKCRTCRTMVLIFYLDRYRHPKIKAKSLKLIICPCSVVDVLKIYACPNYKLMIL